MIRVVIADDHTIVREGLKKALDGERNIDIVAETGDTEATMEAVRRHTPDVLLLDLNMPGAGGLHLIPRLKALQAPPGIVVLTFARSDEFGARTLQAGADGYLEKTCTTEELLEAIRTVHRGERYLPLPLVTTLLNHADSDKAPHARLSAIEFNVFLELAKGKSVRTIAEEVHRSPKTIQVHRGNIMKKMEFASIADLVRYAMQHGLHGQDDEYLKS